MVGTKGADQAIDIKFDRVGAGIADGQAGVALLNVGEGGGHGGLQLLKSLNSLILVGIGWDISQP